MSINIFVHKTNTPAIPLLRRSPPLSPCYSSVGPKGVILRRTVSSTPRERLLFAQCETLKSFCFYVRRKKIKTALPLPQLDR